MGMSTLTSLIDQRPPVLTPPIMSTPSSPTIRPPEIHAHSTPTSPHASTASPNNHLNPRSCVTCRRRKVRCNKKEPCSNCTKQGIECVFPGPGRAPRKSRKPPDTELLARLRRLEGVVQTLGAQVDEEGRLEGEHKPLDTGRVESWPRDNSIASTQELTEHTRKDSTRSSIDNELGRLVINDGRSRYVTNRFWATMGNEIAEMRDILDNPSSEGEEDHPSPEAVAASPGINSHQAFIFNFSSLVVNLRSLHPSPSQVFILWQVWTENVDPLVRILHRPTAKNILHKASANTDALSKAAEALLFAIYFGAIVSLSSAQCESLLGDTKTALIARYRFATEQALARANFMNSSSLMTLQAFVFFLVCVRHSDDSRLVWVLSSIAIQLARAQGVHRDGTHFGIGPFEIEMRRRLWWHISILDSRSAEDQGTDPTFGTQFYDTKLPMNINDDEIHPEMKEPPVERIGTSEMTFCLIRFELTAVIRRMNFAPPGGGDICTAGTRTLEEKEKMIDECHKRIEEKYLRHCDMTVPVFWVAATVGRLILAKIWLMAHHPLQYAHTADDGTKYEPTQETKDRLFITSVEVIEFSYLLEASEHTAKWGWLFRTYMQWHAVAFVLSELCVRPPGPDADRAWRAVESVYDEQVIGNPRNQRGMLWKPMRMLMKKAQAIRAKQNMNADVNWASTLLGDVEIVDRYGSGTPPKPFGLRETASLDTVSDPTKLYGGAAFDNSATMMPSPGADLPLQMEGIVRGQQQRQQQQQQQAVKVEKFSLSSIPNFPASEADLQEWMANGSTSMLSMSQDPLMQQQQQQLFSQTDPDVAADFLKWGGWNPGVGDFSVGVEPVVAFQPAAGWEQTWY